MKKSQKGFSLIETLIILVFLSLIGFIGWHTWIKHDNLVVGSKECVTWVKKIEGDNFTKIYKLDCSLTPRRIANSSLAANYLHYIGQIKGGCPIDPGFSGGSEPPGCTSWAGTVLNNGKRYNGVGDKQVYVPSRMDYCYDNLLDIKPSVAPTSHDLYFYQGDLYDRDVFNNTEVKTPYGSCLLNGTTIYRPNPDITQHGGVGQLFTSNVVVQYKNFPKDCFTVTIGHPADDELTCIDYITAANGNLDSCHTNKTPLVVDGKITGYKSELQVYDGQYTNGDCESVFVERMAALNQCQNVHITKFLATNTDVNCMSWITHPAEGVTRISTVM